MHPSPPWWKPRSEGLGTEQDARTPLCDTNPLRERDDHEVRFGPSIFGRYDAIHQTALDRVVDRAAPTSSERFDVLRRRQRYAADHGYGFGAGAFAGGAFAGAFAGGAFAGAAAGSLPSP